VALLKSGAAAVVQSVGVEKEDEFSKTIVERRNAWLAFEN
jgi:hypothetical protein